MFVLENDFFVIECGVLTHTHTQVHDVYAFLSTKLNFNINICQSNYFCFDGPTFLKSFIIFNDVPP